MTPEQLRQAEEIISKYETYVRLSQPHNTTPIFLKENVLLMMEEYNQLSAPRIEITEEETKDLKRIRNYFGEHDKTLFEHHAYTVIDRLLSRLHPSEKTEQLNIPTDEEIYKAANANIKSTWKGHSQGYYYHFVEGAEWMREKLTGTKSEDQQKGAPFDEEKTMM